MRQLRVRVVTPRSVVLDEACEAVVAPLRDGWIGIWPGHAPFQARLQQGQIAIRSAGHRRVIATLGGVIAADGAGVTVLTGEAAPDVDLARLERDIGTQAEQLGALERAAEAHFEQLYRAMADTFNRRGGRRRS